MRFWDPQQGAITIGGHDLRNLPESTLRALIAYVPQDVYLFDGTIRQNIALGQGALEAADADIVAAATAAQAHDFIAALPEGYDTPIGERGLKLSGGQRQRIAIARALLKDSPILVLDEAVSNIDYENERLLRAALLRLSTGRTTLVIAHRFSTIAAADRVVVLDEGRVVEEGKLGALMARNGHLSRLLAAQFPTAAAS